MYALVMWIGDEPTTSVVDWNDVEVVGKDCRAKCGSIYQPAQVLCQDVDKKWLQSLPVIANGQIVWCRSVEDNDNAQKSQESKDGGDVVNSESKDGGDVVNSESKDGGYVVNSGKQAEPSPSQTPKHYEMKPIIVTNLSDGDDHDASDRTNDHGGENKNDYSDSGSSNDSDYGESIAENAVRKITKSPLHCTSICCPPRCDSCPQVTAEMVAFFKHYVTHLEESLEKVPTNATDESIPRKVAEESVSRKGMVELSPGSDAWISRAGLAEIKRRWLKRPKYMVRRLMYGILGKEALRKMTPKGCGTFEGIPENVYLAVESFVNENTSPGYEITRMQYTKCLTLMCCNLRKGSGNVKPVGLSKRRRSSERGSDESRLDPDWRASQRKTKNIEPNERKTRQRMGSCRTESQ